MADRPILFSAPMVRALLDGRKTQTRRILKPKKHACLISEGWTDDYVLNPGNREWLESYYRWRVGDRLWVRETAAQNEDQVSETVMRRNWMYRADGEERALDNGDPKPWLPSIFMPRVASRLTLAVTDVRVQRLQDIDLQDAFSEGCEIRQMSLFGADKAGRDEIGRIHYRWIWEEINGAESWRINPWVIALTFSVERRNIDKPLLLSWEGADIAGRDGAVASACERVATSNSPLHDAPKQEQ